MRLGRCGLPLARLGCIVVICQAWEDYSTLEHLEDIFNWNAPSRLYALEEGAVTNPSLSSPHPPNHHQTQISSYSNRDGPIQGDQELSPHSRFGLAGMYEESLAHSGMIDSGDALQPASQQIIYSEKDPGTTLGQQHHLTWRLPGYTPDGGRQLASSDRLMPHGESLLPNGVSHLSVGEKESSPAERQGFHFYKGGQSASVEARDVPENHLNRKRPLMTWSAPEGHCPQYCECPSSPSLLADPGPGQTKRHRFSKLPIKLGLTHQAFIPSFDSQPFLTPPVVHSEAIPAQTSTLPALSTQPESAHNSLAPKLHTLSFSQPAIHSEVGPAQKIHFVEPWMKPGSSIQPATLHYRVPDSPWGKDHLTAFGMDRDVASRHQNLFPEAEREIDCSGISHSQIQRIDLSTPIFRNLETFNRAGRWTLTNKHDAVSHLKNLEFDLDAFRENQENQGIKEWMRTVITKKVNDTSQKKLLLRADRTYEEIKQLVVLSRTIHIQRRLIPTKKYQREKDSVEAKQIFLNKKAVWHRHWLIHQRLDVTPYLHRLEDRGSVRMQETFYLFLFYVEMIIAIVPKPRMDAGLNNQASELKSACDFFVELIKTLQLQRDLLVARGNPKQLERAKFFNSRKPRGKAVQLNRIIWEFLEEWIKKYRRNIIHPGATSLSCSVKCFFGDVFYLTIRNLNLRYEPLLDLIK